MAADFNDQSGGEEMEENRYSSRALTAMKNLNLLIILYISVLAAFCLSGIVQENSAAEFLARIPVLPGVSLSALRFPVFDGHGKPDQHGLIFKGMSGNGNRVLSQLYSGIQLYGHYPFDSGRRHAVFP